MAAPSDPLAYHTVCHCLVKAGVLVHAGSPFAPLLQLYINNINDKVKKSALRKSLHSVFSPFGKILDIICIRTKALRGQAWIVFSDPSAAAASLRQMQGFPFYDKPMRLQFSRKPSKKAVQTLGEAGRLAAAANSQALAAAASAAVAHGGASAASPVLFVGGFPPQVSPDMLVALFSQYGQASASAGDAPGVVSLRFADAEGAARAFQNLQGFRVTPTHQLQLSYSATAITAAPEWRSNTLAEFQVPSVPSQGLPAPSASHLQATTEGATKEEPASRPAPVSMEA